MVGSKICVFAFVSHMYASSVEQRERELAVVRAVAKQQRANPFVFFWSQQADQQQMQDNLGLEHVFPAIAVYVPGKNRAAAFKGDFHEGALVQWLSGLIDGKTETFMPQAPVKFKRVEKWDGKEYSEEKKDEIKNEL